MNIFPFKFLKTFRKFKISHPCPLSVDTSESDFVGVNHSVPDSILTVPSSRADNGFQVLRGTNSN